MKPVIMKKLNHLGVELWRYPATLIYEDETMIQLEAPFNGREMELMGTPIRPGDLFKETFYKNRWYNIFAIFDRENGILKGWYCNVGMPVVEEEDGVFSYVDLALDLWVDQDGNQFILDAEEFNKLELDAVTRARGLKALKQLSQIIRKHKSITRA